MKKNLNNLAKCLCGGINIKIKGKLRNVSNCHCSQCMKTHGNFASYTSCDDKQIIYLNKKTLKWFKSSKIAKRGFCSKCGASFFYKRYNTDKISIAAGMFNKKIKLKTYANIFTKGKMNYYKLDKKIPKYNKYINK
tara:strand:+ start:3155 stop:3562 length:408 start_codon:yes stop_codon:yes gene_type:complete